jgi:hypothetical protein
VGCCAEALDPLGRQPAATKRAGARVSVRDARGRSGAFKRGLLWRPPNTCACFLRWPQAVAKLAVEADAIDAVVDFDSHLDDPAQDWRNAAVCARVLALVK